jgi:Ca2+-binding EF-hand superfamily protein
VTLQEFSENLRRMNLDRSFTSEEQRLYFERFDRNHTSVLSLPLVLSRVPQINVKAQSSPSPLSLLPPPPHLPLNDWIQLKLSERPRHPKAMKRPQSLKADLLRSFRQYDTANTGLVTPEALVPILDSSGLRLRLSAEEIRATLEKTPSTSGQCQIDYSQFIDALELHRSADAIEASFFDARSTQIARLKHRARELNASREDSQTLLGQLSVETKDESLVVSPVKCAPAAWSSEGAGGGSRVDPSAISQFSPQKPLQARPTISPRSSNGTMHMLLTSLKPDLTPPPRLSLPTTSLSSSGACDELCSTSRSLPGTSSSDPYRTVHSEAFSPVTFNAKEFVRPGVVGDALRESAERAVRRLLVSLTSPLCLC